jgi:hypothetical protein
VESHETLVQGALPGRTSERPTGRGPFRRAPQRDHAEPAGEQLVLERYRLLERLGAGGFGVVWRARDELLHREVAVKRIWLGPDGDGERAAREAQASARLSHPAIVALYEACPLGEAFYLISELVRGSTLARLIAEDELSDEQVLAIGMDLVDALEHAHARGVIHRDIKPQNVLVPDRAEQPGPHEHRAAAKLTDFGGASLAEEDALTRTGDVLGTLAYMAPEQSEGYEAGEAADLYSLALVLHEALSGVNPARGATPAETARRIGTRLQPLGRARRDLPRGLTGALDRALAPDPTRRGTLADLRVALAEGLAERLEEGSEGAPARTLRQPRRPGAILPRRAPVAEPAPEAPADPREAGPYRLLVPEPRPEPRPEPLGQGGPGLPRLIWCALGLALVVWEIAAGRPGLGLLALAALLALAVMPSRPDTRRVPGIWVGCALAPALGLVGLAGAFPALAGQASQLRQRFAIGAVGYWWLRLAEPLLGRRLWLGQPSGAPTRAAWEGSLQSAATHIIEPLLSGGVLAGAVLWGLGAALLPVIVRGRSAALDVLAAALWSAGLLLAAARLDSGLGGALEHPSPRGAVLGAVLGAMIAIAARALRGPV